MRLNILAPEGWQFSVTCRIDGNREIVACSGLWILEAPIERCETALFGFTSCIGIALSQLLESIAAVDAMRLRDPLLSEHLRTSGKIKLRQYCFGR